MDFAFSRRVVPSAKAVDLGSLLAMIGAAQAASPTGRAQQRLIARDKTKQHDNPQLALFADAKPSVPNDIETASFAAAFSVRQPK